MCLLKHCQHRRTLKRFSNSWDRCRPSYATVLQNNAAQQKAQPTSSTWTPIFSTQTSSFFKAQRVLRPQRTLRNGGAVEGRKFDRPSESKKKGSKGTKLWRLLHIERRLRRYAHRLCCYPEAAPSNRTFLSCETMQVRHVIRMPSRNIREKPNTDLLNKRHC